MLGGCVLGGAFAYFLFRRELDSHEWMYLKEFRDALRWKRYRELGEKERSEEDGTQD